MMDSAVIVLPDPDSPTRPIVSPCRTYMEQPRKGVTLPPRTSIVTSRSCRRSKKSSGCDTLMSSTPQPNFEGVPQSVPDEVKRDNQNDDEYPGRV